MAYIITLYVNLYCWSQFQSYVLLLYVCTSVCSDIDLHIEALFETGKELGRGNKLEMKSYKFP